MGYEETYPIPDAPMVPDEIFTLLSKRADGALLTGDFDQYREALDEVAPARAIVTITEAPPGFPPDEVRAAWIGLTLPIRTRLDGGDQGYTILAREAIEALRRDRPEAFEWWRDYYEMEASERGYGTGVNNDDGSCREWYANLSYLRFEWDCGTPELVEQS